MLIKPETNRIAAIILLKRVWFTDLCILEPINIPSMEEGKSKAVVVRTTRFIKPLKVNVVIDHRFRTRK